MILLQKNKDEKLMCLTSKSKLRKEQQYKLQKNRIQGIRKKEHTLVKRKKKKKSNGEAHQNQSWSLKHISNRKLVSTIA